MGSAECRGIQILTIRYFNSFRGFLGHPEFSLPRNQAHSWQLRVQPSRQKQQKRTWLTCNSSSTSAVFGFTFVIIWTRVLAPIYIELTGPHTKTAQAVEAAQRLGRRQIFSYVIGSVSRGPVPFNIGGPASFRIFRFLNMYVVSLAFTYGRADAM